MKDNYLPKKYREYLGLGAEIAASIAGPIIIGYATDQYFNTQPWFTLAGIALGLALFIFTAIRIAGRLNN